MKETVHLPVQSQLPPPSVVAEAPRPKLQLVRERVHKEVVTRDSQKTSDWEISI